MVSSYYANRRKLIPLPAVCISKQKIFDAPPEKIPVPPQFNGIFVIEIYETPGTIAILTVPLSFTRTPDTNFFVASGGSFYLRVYVTLVYLTPDARWNVNVRWSVDHPAATAMGSASWPEQLPDEDGTLRMVSEEYTPTDHPDINVMVSFGYRTIDPNAAAGRTSVNNKRQTEA